MALGPASRGSLRRPPSRTVDPLDPTAILEDAEDLPILARNVSSLRKGLAQGTITPERGRQFVAGVQQVEAGEAVAPGPAPFTTPEQATEPVAKFDSRTPEVRARQQNEFRAVFNQSEPPARVRLASLLLPPPNGRTAPTVVGPAQRAVAAAIDRTGADLPRPPAAPAPEQLDPVQPQPHTGRTLAETRVLVRQAAARQRAALKPVRDKLRATVSPVFDRSLRSIQAVEDESVAAQTGLHVATGAGGGLFASSPVMIRQAEAAEKLQQVPDGEGFEPIRNLFRGLAAGGLGLGESTGTILRYLGGELGIDAVAELGEDIEAFFQPRMRAFVERAAQTFRSDQNIIDNPELLLDLDFLTFTIGQIIPSLLATITPVGVGRLVVRKLAHKALTKKLGVTVSAGVAAAAEAERVAITGKQLAGLGKGLARQGTVAKATKDFTIKRFIKIGDRTIDIANPAVVAKLARIGRAANAVGFTLGGLSGGALEGSATYRETLDILIEQGVPEDIARETAENAFLMMTAGSGVLNAVGLKVLLASAPKLLSVEGVKARAIRGLVESLTEYLEGPLEAGIQFGQGTITVEQVMQKIKDEANVLPAAFVAGFFIPGAGSQLGYSNDNIKPPAQSAAETTQVDEPGDLPPVDPGAGAAGQAVNVTTEEASATAQAEAEEVDETTVQEADEGVATKKAGAKPKAAAPSKPKATEPAPSEAEVVTAEDLVTEPTPEPEGEPEDFGDQEPEPTAAELAAEDERPAVLTADELIASRAVLTTDEDGEFDILRLSKPRLLEMADEFGVTRRGTKRDLVVRITDQARKDVEGLDVEEIKDAETIPDTEDQVQVGRVVTEGGGREGGEDIQQPQRRADGSKKADRKGGESRATKAGAKEQRKPSGKKPVAKATKKDKPKSVGARDSKVQAALDNVGSKVLNDEVGFLTDTQREGEDGTVDLYVALQDAEQNAEEDGNKKLLKAARLTLIELGVYAPITEEELARVQVSSGKKFAFKLNGIKYDFVGHLADVKGKSEKLRGQKIPKIGVQGSMTLEELEPIVDVTFAKDDAGSQEELKVLAKQIKKDGITTPLKIIVEDGVPTKIADGNHRVEVMKRLGLKKAPVRFVTAEQADIETLAEDEFLAVGGTPEEAAEKAIGIDRSQIEKIGEPTGRVTSQQFRKEFEAKDSLEGTAGRQINQANERIVKGMELIEEDFASLNDMSMSELREFRKTIMAGNARSREDLVKSIRKEAKRMDAIVQKFEADKKPKALLSATSVPVTDAQRDKVPKKECAHCFDNSYRILMKVAQSGEDAAPYTLVHAFVTNAEGRTFEHAWVEQVVDGKKIAIDSARSLENPIRMDADKFRSALNATNIIEYNELEMMLKAVRSRNFGPWDLPASPPKTEAFGESLSASDEISAVIAETEEEIEEDKSFLSATAADAQQDFTIKEDKFTIAIKSFNEGLRVSFMGAFKRAENTLQIASASVREPSQGRGIGQQLIIKMHGLATDRNLTLVSDSVVSTDQIRAYMGLRRKGWGIVFSHEEEVDAALDKAKATGILQFVTFGDRKPVVIRIQSPQQQKDELTLGEAQGALFSGETTVKRLPDFSLHGEYLVTLPSGATHKIFRDQDTGWWFAVGKENFHNQNLLGFTRAEAIKELEEGDAAQFSATGGRAGTSERVAFSQEETQQIEKVVAKLEPGQRSAARLKIREDRQKFPPSKGWARMEPKSVDTNDKGEVTAIEYKPVHFTFEKDAATGKPYSRAKDQRQKLDRRKKTLAKKTVDAIRVVEKAAKGGAKWAKDILAQRVWYTAVTTRLRLEFGGAADLVADLLGATSPRKSVAKNFDMTVDAVRQLSAGKFDKEMKAFVAYLEEFGTSKGYKGPTVTKINGKKYGTNTKQTMLALANVWRVVRPGQSPKSRIFTGNLIGISDMATIDSWAARFMDFIAGRKRVPPKAENPVTGRVNARGDGVGGQYGFAQDVFDLAAADLNMTTKDVQAIVWFIEKKRWNDAKWSTEEAAGGSIEQQLDIADLTRVLAGISIQQESDPSNAEQNKISVRIKKFFQSDPNSIAFRMASSLGLYAGDAERSFDLEATVGPDFNIDSLVQELAKIGQENNQTDVFVSRVLSPTANNLNARPGIEVYFKGAKTLQEVQPILDSLVADGIDGFTMVVDPRAHLTGTGSEETFIGVRYQFVPEIKARYDSDFVADVRSRGMDVILDEQEDLLVIAADKLMQLGAAHVQLVHYDTIVFGQENYADYTRVDRTTDQEAGRVWFGQPVVAAVEAAVSRYQKGTGAADAGDLSGSVQQAEAGAAGEFRRADQSRPGTVDKGAAEISAPPVREDGRVELKHWSRKTNIKELDPSFHGKGLRGEDWRRKANNSRHWTDRTYYGIGVGVNGGYVKELGLGPVEYTASVELDQLYDIRIDPLGLQQQAAEDGHQGDTHNTVWETSIHEAGFTGYWVKDDQLGMVAAVFDKLNTEVSDDRSDTTTQATTIKQSTAGQISATADNQLAGDVSEVAPPSRPASAAEGAAEQLSDPTADSVLFSADDRLSTVTDPKDRGTKRKTPLKADVVRAHLLAIINRLSSIVNIRIVQSHSNLPESIQLRMKRDQIDTVRGVYMPTSNTLYIVADSAVSLAGSERTILHEAFGHFAMESMPAFASIKARLEKIIANKSDPVINRLVKSVQAKGHVSRDQFLSEVIAEMSETMTSANAVMKEVIALVKEVIRALGFTVEMTNTDIMALIRGSRRRIERRALAAAGFGIDTNSQKYVDFLKSKQLVKLHKAQSDQEIGIALEELAKEFDTISFSASATMTPELDDDWKKIMNTPLRDLSWHDKLKKTMQRFHDLSFDEVTQGMLDTFNATATNEIAAYGTILDSSVSPYKAMSTIRNLNNVMGAIMYHGIPALKRSFITLVDGTKVRGINFVAPENGLAFSQVWTPLGEIPGDDQQTNWSVWAVATRGLSEIKKDIAAGRTGKARREKLIELDLAERTIQYFKDQVAPNGKTHDEIFKEVQANWVIVKTAALDLGVDTGVIDQVERQVWDSNDYIPFARELSKLESGVDVGKGSSRVDVGSAGLFRLTGSVDREGNPARLEGNIIESMFMNITYLMDRSYRNAAHQRTVEAALITGAYTKEPQQAKPQRIPNVKAADLIKMLYNVGIINAATEEDAVDVYKNFSKAEKDKWLTFFNRVAPTGPNLVTLMVKGKPVYYYVRDKLLHRSIVGMQGKNYGMWMSAMRTSKKWLTIGVTTDPAFMLANWIRDTVQTLIVSRAPLHSFADPIKSIREAFNDSPAMLAMAFAGRSGGAFYDLNPEKISDLLKEMGVPGKDVNGFLATVMSPKKLFRFWKRIGTASEFGNRVRVYNSLLLVWNRRIAELGQRGIKGQDAIEQAISEGVASPDEAAFQAQDLLNFTRSGDFVAIQNLIQVIPFLNARMQGINKLWRGAREAPLSFASKGGALMAISLSIAIANDDDDRYNALADWDKDTYYHFWIQGEHIRIPKPFESGVLFSTIPERIWRAGRGIDGWDTFSRSMLHAVLDTFAFNPIPQLAKPAIESFFNYNIFTSTPVIPAGMENMLPQSQYDWRTGEFAKWVGDAMPDSAPDVMQSPKRIEHLMRGYFGALGVYAMSVANVMTDTILHGPERALGEITAMRLHETPVLKRFLRPAVPHTTIHNRQMWETVREGDAIARTLKKYQEEGLGQKALGLAHDEAKILAVRPLVRRMATAVSKINKQINQISLDRRLSPERRATLRDQLLRQRHALTKQIEPILDYL